MISETSCGLKDDGASAAVRRSASVLRTASDPDGTMIAPPGEESNGAGADNGSPELSRDEVY